MPGAPVAPGSGWMRRTLPLWLLELAAVRWASQNARPGRSSIGVVAVGGERVRVVAGGDVEVAVRRRRRASRRSGSTARAARSTWKMNCSEAGLIVLFAPTVKRETRVMLLVSGSGVYATYRWLFVSKSGSSAMPMRPVLLHARDAGSDRRRHLAVDRVVDVHLAGDALDVEDAAVVGDGELHRALGVVVDRDDLEVVRPSAGPGAARRSRPPRRRSRSGGRRGCAGGCCPRRCRTTPPCGPCPCTRRGRRRSPSTTRSGDRRRWCCRPARRTSPR